MLNACAHDTTVDWVILGCPHCSVEELGEICHLFVGRKVYSNVRLWIVTPRALKTVADRTGYTRMISEAGGVLMSDACPAEGRVKPQGVKVVATNSSKQAHCLTGIPGMQCWFGSTADCISAAVTGKWQGELK
jgi:predicted aconitase